MSNDNKTLKEILNIMVDNIIAEIGSFKDESKFLGTNWRLLGMEDAAEKIYDLIREREAALIKSCVYSGMTCTPMNIDAFIEQRIEYNNKTQ